MEPFVYSLGNGSIVVKNEKTEELLNTLVSDGSLWLVISNLMDNLANKEETPILLSLLQKSSERLASFTELQTSINDLVSACKENNDKVVFKETDDSAIVDDSSDLGLDDSSIAALFSSNEPTDTNDIAAMLVNFDRFT